MRCVDWLLRQEEPTVSNSNDIYAECQQKMLLCHDIAGAFVTFFVNCASLKCLFIIIIIIIII